MPPISWCDKLMIKHFRENVCIRYKYLHESNNYLILHGVPCIALHMHYYYDQRAKYSLLLAVPMGIFIIACTHVH